VSEIQPYDEEDNRRRVEALRSRGVDVWGPERVYVAPDVPLENIEPGCSLRHCTIEGAKTRIGRGAVVGLSGHARVADCQIARDAELGAGSFEGATILEEARVRGFAELRPGTLLEEQVEAAHSVAFKNTVLTATAVTGSVLNFCDVFLSGGASRERHSEVGSGVVHFNFDPRGDKWGSQFGDARGVLLRSRPIFVGGQCGLVAPIHVDFGAVVAAGSLVRSDVGPDCLHSEAPWPTNNRPFHGDVYAGLRRKFLATARLIGSLWALEGWYERVRRPFTDSGQRPFYEAAQGQCLLHRAERVRRINKILNKLEDELARSSDWDEMGAYHDEHRFLVEHRERIMRILSPGEPFPAAPSALAEEYERARAQHSHVESVRRISPVAARAAEQWLLKMAGKPARELNELLGRTGA